MKYLLLNWRHIILVLICYLLLQGMSAQAQDYQLEVGDTLVVTVVNHPEFGGTVTVTTDGSIQLPVVGRYQVVGKTAMEVAGLLRSGYTRRLLKPEVYVTISAMHSTNVFALGAVKNPGAYSLQDKMGAFQLLLAANGLSQAPEDCRATILRKATKERVSLTLADLLAGQQNADVPLSDGDVLLIETRPTLAVYVTGDVHAPGLYELPEGDTVSQALVRAQGVQGDATQERVVILRGKETKIVEASLNSLGGTDADVPMQKGDVLRVEPAVMSVNIAGEVARPATYTVKRDLSVKDLLTLAGGPTGAARLKEVTLVHSNGVQDKIDLLRDAGYGDTSRLQPGDVVTVPSALVSVRVDGEVKLPGPYRFPTDMHLPDIIMLAGGANDNAALSSVYLTRLDGSLETLDACQTAKQGSKVALHEGDRIVVPTLSTRVAVAGNVKTPGFYPMDERKPYTVSEAVLRAGGLADHSDPKRVTVTRVANGASTQFTVNLNKATSSGDPHDNPMLQPGDTVYAPAAKGGWMPSLSDTVSVLSIISLLRGSL